MFDPNNGAVARKLKFMAGVAIAFYVTALGTGLWVAIHFISKFW